MTGIGLIILLLALVGIFSGLYLAAWWFCGVRRSPKQGQYILENDELEENRFSKSGQDQYNVDPNEKQENRFSKPNIYTPYPGLDMVDESKETYVQNPMEFDTINENKPILAGNPTSTEMSPSAPNDSHQQSQDEA